MEEEEEEEDRETVEPLSAGPEGDSGPTTEATAGQRDSGFSESLTGEWNMGVPMYLRLCYNYNGGEVNVACKCVHVLHSEKL